MVNSLKETRGKLILPSRGTASYRCYDGFGFQSGQSIETIQCTAEGTWSYLPECLASQCPPLPDVEHATRNLLSGKGTNYGTVVRYDCDPGYERSGLPVILCQTDGTWSSGVPTCSRKSCPVTPKIENGFMLDADREYLFGDQGMRLTLTFLQDSCTVTFS